MGHGPVHFKTFKVTCSECRISSDIAMAIFEECTKTERKKERKKERRKEGKKERRKEGKKEGKKERKKERKEATEPTGKSRNSQ